MLDHLAGSLYLLGTLAFVLVSTVIGIRLALLSRKTGQRPELLLGLGILGTAVLGYGPMIASMIIRGPDNENVTPVAIALTALGKFLHDAGVTLVLCFVLTVFRPGDARAKLLFGAAMATLWGGMIGVYLTTGFRDVMERNVFFFTEYAVIWTYPLWGAYESFRYHHVMKKRLRLGLADPLVVNRFLLWGLASLGTFAAIWLASWAVVLPDPTVAQQYQTFNYLSTATVGIATVIAYSLAFLPPARYRRWVVERAAGEAQAA